VSSRTPLEARRGATRRHGPNGAGQDHALQLHHGNDTLSSGGGARRRNVEELPTHARVPYKCELSRRTTLREPYGRGERPPGDRGPKAIPLGLLKPLSWHTDLMEESEWSLEAGTCGGAGVKGSFSYGEQRLLGGLLRSPRSPGCSSSMSRDERDVPAETSPDHPALQ